MPSAEARPPSPPEPSPPAGDRTATGPAPRRLWLVRHARPLVDAGLCYGRQDVAADAAHTRETAVRLARALPPGAMLRTSPRTRCRALADALAALRPDLRPDAVDARLAEMDFGEWEGRRWDAIGAEALDAWTADFAHHRPGGGESVAAFMARVGGAFDALPAAADSVWICHAGVARAAALLLQGRRRIDHATDWPREGPDFGRWTVLALSADAGAGGTAGAPVSS